jgi:hypothetical protein
MLPKLICTAVRTDHSADPIEIDISVALLNGHLSQAKALIAKLDHREPIYLYDILPAIPGDWRKAFESSLVRVPNLYDCAAAFSRETRGPEGLQSWWSLAKAKQQATWHISSTQRLQRAIHAAEFIPLARYAEPQVYDDIGDAYYDPDSAIDASFDLADLNAEIGPRNWSAPEEEAAIYNRKANAWVRANARPFAFATVQRDWAGITVESVHSIVDDNPDLTESQFLESAWSDLESDLNDNHYEGAFDDIKLSDDLDAALKAWFAAFRNSDADTAEASELLIAWNRKQSITSHFPDMGKIVGLFADASHDEAKAWVDKYVAEASAAADEIDALWRTPILDREGAIADAQEAGYTITSGPRHTDSPSWKWFTPAEQSAEFLTLELCVEAINARSPSNGDAR